MMGILFQTKPFQSQLRIDASRLSERDTPRDKADANLGKAPHKST